MPHWPLLSENLKRTKSEFNCVCECVCACVYVFIRETKYAICEIHFIWRGNKLSKSFRDFCSSLQVAEMGKYGCDIAKNENDISL